MLGAITIPMNPFQDFLGDRKEDLDAFSENFGNTITFAADPLGAIFQATRNGAEGLATELLPALSKATEPDLSADFFIQAYAISFAAAIMIWGLLLIVHFVAVARGHMAGQDFVDTLFMRSVVFFAGALFGPWVGVFLVKLFGSLSDSLIVWGVGSSADKMLETMTHMLAVDPAAIPGGVIVGILLMICMILGFLLVVVMLAVMLVTLYLSGVVLPLGLVWIASGKHDAMAKRIPVLWLCLLAAHPLLFFLMGFAFNMIAASADWMKWSGGLETLMSLVAAVVAMAIAGMSPMLLMKFAPVMPSGAGQQSGPSMSAPEKSHGPQSLKEAKEEMRTSKPGINDSSPGDQGDQKTGGADGADGGGGKSSGLLSKLKELKGGPEEASPDSGGGLDAKGSKAPAGAGGGASAAAKPGAGAETIGSKMPGGAASGAPAGATAGAGAGAAAGGATGGAAAVAETGAAESSTGAGAVLGIPTLLAAGAMAVAEKAKEVGEEATRLGEAAGGYAAGDMRDDEEGK
uniref:hypothetical protein n=1 Tax=Arthrobacter sp. TaxID=1667 RepID=UPI000EB71307|nr:hypothetical protein [Arthrobacter sp.]AXV46684.1 hypothetical protein pA58H3_p70 [Arthrobacter sp.]